MSARDEGAREAQSRAAQSGEVPSLDSRERSEPSFRALLAQNARLLALALLAAGLAYSLWRGLVWLFPDVAWLAGPQ